MKFDIRAPSEYESMPWKNGLGTTLELLKYPSNSGAEFSLRMSIAAVTEDGDFSSFTGIDRTLVLLDGEGVTLDHCDGAQNVLTNRLECARFKGDVQTIAYLHDGPIKDFNVMANRAELMVKVFTNNEAASSLLDVDADLTLLYAVDENVSIKLPAHETFNLAKHHLFISSDCKNVSITSMGGATIAVLVYYQVWKNE